MFAKATTWLDFTRMLGVAPNEFDDVYQVKDEKITAYASTMTEAALARFLPAFYEVAPPEPTLVQPSDPPSSEMNVTFAAGTCVLDASKYMLDLIVSTTGYPPFWAPSNYSRSSVQASKKRIPSRWRMGRSKWSAAQSPFPADRECMAIAVTL